MKYWKKTLFWCCLCLALACETDPPASTDNSIIDSKDSIVLPDSAGNIKMQAPANLQNCTISEKHLEKNIFLVTDEAKLLTIVANESTEDPNLGDSHRIFKVLNAKNCSTILEQTLPINRSADFPYYLVPETYNFDEQIVAIQGFSTLFYYDVKNQSLIGPITPQFMGETEAVDAQSGMVKGLTLWKQYLLGHALDFGNFAFDISATADPKPVFPLAKYLIPNTTNLNILFVLETGDQKYQAIIPTQDLDAGGNTFDLYELFTEPLPIDPNVAPNVRDNRYIIFNQKDKTEKVVVDMFGKRQIPLPEDIAIQNTSKILEWLKLNG